MKTIHKQIGETPLEALERFRELHPEYKDERLSYAGRLDPMASGKLLILEREENDHRDEFLGLDKTYEFSILFGVSTDSFDLLGLVDELDTSVSGLTDSQVDEVLQSFTPQWEMEYPPYSAQTVEVDGKMTPLWKLARVGRIEDAKLPTKKIAVYEIGCSDVKEVEKNYIINYITNYIIKLKGDFRQEAIVKRWQEALEEVDTPLLIANCQVSGSAGLYVRRLAHEVGKRLECPSLAFSITRTKIGDY